MSLYERLKNAAERDKIRMHTPGHKGKVCGVDLTELTDGSFPNSFVSEAESNIAEFYGAKHCSMLVGGSSQGVKAAIYYSGANGIISAHSHRAVFDGFTLSGKRCITVGNRDDVRAVRLSDVERAVTPDIGVVVVTSPTYYGFCADTSAIHEYCKRNGLLFIVDGAHGAHFGGSPLLPEAVIKHCDICNLSTHKTLSALTQTAVLLDNLDDSNAKKLRDAVDIMGTTSPSYILCASIEESVNKLRGDKDNYERLYTEVRLLKEKLPFIDNDDFTRLALDCSTLDISPETLNARLCARGVFPERVDARYIVFILTAADSAENVTALGREITACLNKGNI